MQTAESHSQVDASRQSEKTMSPAEKADQLCAHIERFLHGVKGGKLNEDQMVAIANSFLTKSGQLKNGATAATAEKLNFLNRELGRCLGGPSEYEYVGSKGYNNEEN